MYAYLLNPPINNPAMKIKLLCMAVVTMLMCSCSSVRHTSSTYGVDTKIVNYTVADMDVQPVKVSKTYSWSYNPFKRVSIERVKTNVTAQLLNEAGGDVLVEPQYIVEKRGWLRGGSVTVIGFPAKYKNFHKMTESEAAIMRDALQSDKPAKKPHKRWIFF